MKYAYMPVMVAKRGEFSALQQLPDQIANRTLPLFELPSRKRDATQIERSIAKTASSAAKVWSGREAYFDISKWKSNDRTESRMHVLEFSFRHFRSAGVNVLPVIGYDRWDDPTYRAALRNIVFAHNLTPCIRIDRESIEDDVSDLEYFYDRVRTILQDLSISPGECPIILDFGNVADLSVPTLIDLADSAIRTINGLGFKSITLVGGSMPSAVNEAVEFQDTSGCIPRIEMMGWKAVSSGTFSSEIAFGDYLIRCPSAIDGVIAPHANAKIRYTINNQFFIVRGHSKMYDSLTRQNKELATKLISSRYFAGAAFSWGDSELTNCAIGTREVRDATTMIAIDSNHHIMAIVDEILEHKRVVSSII